MNHGHVNDLTRSLPQQPVTRRAVLRFLAQGGRRAVITTPELAEKALAGEIGTQVTAP